MKAWKSGEFYTPASIVKTIVAILKPFDNCRIYRPVLRLRRHVRPKREEIP